MRNGTAVLGAPDFRIAAEIADQNDLVHRTCHDSLLLEGNPNRPPHCGKRISLFPHAPTWERALCARVHSLF
jgi:hypothetical protein